ncbi:hypothetical protein tb265_14310 [Gemmatimonadetes bacterium T265]|nr:hypothetical protein tb265_14310 [Gemmatimonadetes bacterium T265]
MFRREECGGGGRGYLVGEGPEDVFGVEAVRHCPGDGPGVCDERLGVRSAPRGGSPRCRRTGTVLPVPSQERSTKDEACRDELRKRAMLHRHTTRTW